MTEQRHSSLCSKITHLFNEEMFSDVKFISKEGSVEFYGHKLLLALKSSVFADEFYGGTLKKRDILHISDVHSSVLRKMLQFIYTEDIEFEGVKEAHDLNVIAKKYGISTLQAECQAFINKRVVSPELVCKIFEIAKSPQLQFKYVENLCQETFVRQAKCIFQSKQFLKAKMSTVAAILENDALDIDSEMDVLQAVLKWGKTQCCHQCQPTTDANLRLHIEPLLKYVRFLALSLHDLQNFFGTHNILNAVEVCALITAKLQPNSDILLPGILCSQTQSRSLSSEQENFDDDEKFYDCEDILSTDNCLVTASTMPNTVSKKFGLLSSGKDISPRKCEATENANCVTEITKNANYVTEVTENVNCVIEVTKNANCMTTDTNYVNNFEKNYPLISTKDSGEEELNLHGTTCQSIESNTDLLKDNSNLLLFVPDFDKDARQRSHSSPVSMSSNNCFDISNEVNSEFYPRNLQDMRHVSYYRRWLEKLRSLDKN